MINIYKNLKSIYTEENIMKNYIHNYKEFFGKEITTKEIEAGYINYSTLASVFDHVLCNDIAKFFYNYIDREYQIPELVNGSDYDEENECCRDIFQYYIIKEICNHILQLIILKFNNACTLGFPPAVFTVSNEVIAIFIIVIKN